jgi:hypothetical protein
VDSRLFILLAAVALVLVAFVALAVSLTGWSRHRKTKALGADLDAWHAPSALPTEKVDVSLEGLTLEVAPDSPSASLLSPLRTGDWQPPEEPAPAAYLPAVSLAERTKQFSSPAPAVVPAEASYDAPKSAPKPTPAPVPAPAPEPEAAPQPIPAARFENLPDVRPAAVVAAVAARPSPEPEPVPVWAPSEIGATPEALSGRQPVPSIDRGASERPRAHARAIPEDPLASTAGTRPARAVEPSAPARQPAEFLEMVAPIEMWFGDYRVGVRSGSKTHAQFRKYADRLLDDLKGASRRAR